MPKIVLCSDGTGNTANKNRGTNVFKLYEAVDTTAGDQYAWYDDGVGTERFELLKALGGAFGLGLARNVRELYMAFCRAYDPDGETNDTYLFGFSRGAFTVRTLAGFILKFGVVDTHGISDAELRKRVKKAYRLYRDFAGLPPKSERKEKDTQRWQKAEDAANAFCKQNCLQTPEPIRIRFIGVWDTVDAVGSPWDSFTDLLNVFFHFKFSDRTLSDRVDVGRHAIAIDDERGTFEPVLWNEAGETTDRIRQVWFAGVHSNVGGGYPKQGMSLVTLDWMMGEAETAGLGFIPGARESYRATQNVHDKCYDSRSGLAKYYRYEPRDLKKLCEHAGIGTVRIHESAFHRLAVATDGYAPSGVPDDFVTEFPKGRSGDPDRTARDLVGPAYRKLGDPVPLLRHHTNLVTGRKVTQYVFWAVTIASLGLALFSERADSTAATWLETISSMFLPEWAVGLLLRLFGNSYAFFTICAVGLLVWIASTVLRRKQEHLYSSFWNGIEW